MKIMDILVNDAVILNLGGRSKREVLAEMAGALAKVEPQIEADRLLEVLLEREALQSTGIGDGVAIPHGKMAGLDRLVATFARSSQGIDFDSIDREPTHHFFLLVVRMPGEIARRPFWSRTTSRKKCWLPCRPSTVARNDLAFGVQRRHVA